MSWAYNGYRTSITCCYNCEKRHPGCHDTCPVYQEQRQRWEETKEKVRAEKRANEEINSYRSEQHQRYLKRWRNSSRYMPH